MSDIVKLGKGEWAIKDGSVLAVRSVNDKRFYSLPFDFTRSSDATYVGRDGLVKNISEISSGELITNGTFDTNSDWVLDSEWRISGGKLKGKGKGLYGTALQNISGITKKTLKLTFEVSDYVTGTFRVIPDHRSDGVDIRHSGNGVYEVYYEAANENFRLQMQEFEGSIDNVSLKQGIVTNGSFSDGGTLNNGTYSLGWATPDTGLSISSGVLNLVNNGAAFPGRAFLANGTNNYQYLNGAQNYYVKYRVHANTDSANLTYYDGGSYISIDSSVGEHEFYFKSHGNPGQNNLYFIFRNSSSNTTIELDDVFIFQVDDADLPRIDFTDNTDGDLLLEPQSTNLIPYSEDFGSSKWSRNDIDSDYGYQSPTGLNKATKITATGTDPYVFKHVDVTQNQTYTFSIYCKGEGSSLGKTARVLFWYGAGTAVGSTVSHEFNLTSDWKRIQFQTTPTASGTLPFRIDIPANDTTEVGDVAYIWGAQVEELSYATSHISTNGYKVTRLKDKCWNTGTQHDFDSSEGVLYYEAKFAKTGQTGLITIGDANGAPFLLLGHTGSVNTPKLYFDINTGSGSIISPNSAKSDTAINIDNVNKVALSWSPTGYKVYVNGALAHEENKQINMGTTTYGVLNNIYMGYSSSSFLYGNLKELKVYKKAMSASELVALTS